jgi:hypothetical protein
MNHLNDEQFGKFIKDAFPQVTDTELSGDLWPRMLRKLDDSRPRFSWFDWVLAGVAVLLCLIAPGAIPGLLYNL